MTDEANKNPLTIRLTESAVFLRSDGTSRQPHDDSRPSMLRGLLILELAKPTKISSIELELVASAVASWPEGIGARRLEITEERKVFHASTVFFRAGNTDVRRNASIGPGAAYYHDKVWADQHTASTTAGHDAHSTRTRYAERRLSVDNSFFQRIPLSHEEFPIAPTPPYSPPATQPSSPLLPSDPEIMENHPSQSLGEFPDLVDSDLRTSSRSSTGRSLTRSPPSIHSVHPELLSRRLSFEDIPENQPSTPGTPRQSRMPFRSTSHPPTPSIASPDDNRGRSSRLSISSALADTIQPNFSRKHRFAESRESSHEDDSSHLRRGRPQEKGKSVDEMTTSIVRSRGSKDQSTFKKIGALFKLDHNDNQADDQWKEFKKGTYTYPISYAIPANSAPTLLCPHGSVTWRLRAIVHRPGAFTPKFGATREVLVINGPAEGHNEDVENIVVERHWDQQLQYLISVSGRSFYIGGCLPIMFTFMPLAKVKIHQIHVFIEERVDYCTQMKRIAHTDPLTRIELLTLKDTGKVPRPILPLDSDDSDVFKNSPLCALTQPEDDLSEFAATYLGPGPWTLTSNLQLPTSCRRMHMTNKNRKSSILITHLLKCVIRVERGDVHVDGKLGKRRLFDITAQIPIQILSCRCNPEWTSLPSYLESFDDGFSITPRCPCELAHGGGNKVPGTTAGVHTRPSNLESMTTRQSHTSSSGCERSTATTTLPQNDSMFNRSNQYERLISGQESEFGEAPPTYTPVQL
ncbi:hypothetical protein L208DRAFT_1364283 [Tricholoma matsutake]|nr:hypothetical protein L208DRAFT_1364283 [Tricholoma matsutake 945]